MVKSFVAAVLIVLAGCAAYSNSFSGVLVFDDEPALVQNPHLHDPWPVAALIDAMAAPPASTLSGRPVAALSFAIDYVTSADPLFGYHRTNLLVHLAAALLVLGITRRTLLTPALAARYARAATPIATLTALLFVVHPLQTGAVTYVVQRVESLMGLFYLATMYCAIRAGQAKGARRTAWIAASAAACALGMATKEVMVTAPLMVMLWDHHFAQERKDSRRVLYMALASTWVLLAVLVAGGHRSTSVGFGFTEWPWWRYLMTQAGVLVHYLRLVFVPTSLVLDYDWRPAASLATIAIPLIVMALLLAVTIAGVVRRHPAAFAAAWCFLILAPSSSVIPIVTEVAAEHRMYLPIAALMALLAIGIFEAGRRRQAALLAGAVVVVVFGRLTYQRNEVYQSYDRIWADTIDKRPHNARAQNNYASSLLVQGRFAEAEPHLRVAVEERPSFAEAESNLGVALSAQGKLEEGAAHLRRALALRPDDASAHRNLGEAYARLHRSGEAVAEYAAVLARQPDNVEALNRAAWILATTTDPGVRDGARARVYAERAVQLTARRSADALDNLGAALAELGQFDQAVAVTIEAANVAQATGQSSMMADLQQRFFAYRAHQAIRVP